MPPLYHSIPGEKFDIRKSRTLWWLIKQPEILNYVWNNIKQSGFVKYDSVTGKWTGIDFESEESND
nr:MAG TPA: hypothetical protein [Caudoviricetes sp.]